MKAVVLCALALIAVASAHPSDTYTNKFDNINVNEILKNKRLLDPFVKCALEQGKCTPEARELRSHIAEALENYCAKCTEVQRNGSRQVIAHLINHEPKHWADLSAKYDPARKYVVKYEKDLTVINAQG